jgi:hypothetical protein
MSDLWKDDADLFAHARRELFTAVVGDVMDKLGFRHQFLPPAIQPLERSMVTIGRAMTVLEADFFEETAGASHNPLSGRPFGLMLDALDLKADMAAQGELARAYRDLGFKKERYLYALDRKSVV